MKATPSLAKLRNIHKEIKKLIEDISIQNNANYLFQPIEDLWRTSEESKLRVDVLVVDEENSSSLVERLISDISAEELETLKEKGKLELTRGNVNYRLHDEDHFPAKSTKSLPYLFKVILCNPEGQEQEDLSYYFQRFAKESAITFIAGGSKEFQRWAKSQLARMTWRVNLVDEDANLTEQVTKYAEEADLVNMIALNLGTRKILSAIESTIENEYKDLSARKISVQNDHMKLKKMGAQRVGQNLFSTLKSNLQRSFSEFENGINERFTELTKNQPGSLYAFIVDQIDGIHQLEEVTSGGETRYMLPSSTLVELEGQAKAGFEEHLQHDVASLNDYLDITTDEINHSFEENDLSNFNVGIQKLSKTDVQLMLNDQFHFDKQHEAKPLKKGFMSFFSAVRQPYMIIIMMVGILGRVIPDMNLWQQWWFIAIIILALGGGLYFAIQGAKKKKIEMEAEELKKVSQWLKAEYKRIFSTIEKDWKSKYFTHAKNQFSEILRQLELDLKNYQQDRSESISEETNLTQRKIQTLETFDKKLKESQRQKAKITTDLSSLGTELKQNFLKLEL